ncbi:hypothetical protein [Streptomyces sp. NPDC086010]|uniref:hypothetical protein n=1 Tax=Streptomyces sp. NPDC086010 TaxID=3365745 RepID=UPI0037D0467F
MENWREGTRTGHTHEPNDVTVQLDGLGRQLSELPVEPGPPVPADGPVFVDESGRRSKTYRRVGWVLAAICAVYAVTLVVAVLGGNSSAPWLPLSGQDEKRAEKAEVRPAPSKETVPVVAPGATPSGAPATVAGVPGATPSPGASVSGVMTAAPGASASASASVKPPRSNTSSAPAPGNSAPVPPAGETSAPATVAPPVEESPPASPDPTQSPVQPQEGAQ